MLRIYESLFGKVHPNTAGSYTRLALLYQMQYRYKEAVLLYEKAWVGFHSLGPEHPATRMVLDMLINFYDAMGLDDAAVQERLQALFEKPVSDDMDDW